MDMGEKMHPLKGLRLTHLGIADGLSQSTVNCILEDHRGIKWFGTQNGLNRYDGYSFFTYKSADCENSLLSSTITALPEGLIALILSRKRLRDLQLKQMWQLALVVTL